MSIIGIMLLAWRSRNSSQQASWLAFGGVWLLLYSVFFWWWEPFNIEFWIALLPLWGFWIMAGWPSASSEANHTDTVPGKISSILKTAYLIIPMILAILLFRSNLAPVKAAGDPINDYYYLMTTALQPEMAPDDIVVTRGNILDVYIPFYARHTGYLSLRELEYNEGGNRAQMMASLTSHLDESLALGKTIWIDQMVIDEARSADRNPFGLLSDEVDVLKARYSIQPDVMLNGTTAFYSTPHHYEPNTTMWSFDGSLAGWRAWGVAMPSFEQKAWCFTGGDDPQLQSPLLDINTTQWTALEVDVTMQANQSVMQIFWRTRDGDYSLQRSVEVDTARGRHTYVVQLANAPGWTNTITQLRLDPVPGIPDAGASPTTVCLHSIRLLKQDN